MLSPLFHPSILHAFFSLSVSVPSSRSVSVLFFHSAHFVCPFCLSVSVEYCCFALAIAATAAAVMLGSHEQVGSRQGDSRGQEEGGGSTRFPLLTLPHYAFYRLHIKVLFTIQAVDLHLPTVHQFVRERYYK